jgi:hypothetical protein
MCPDAQRGEVWLSIPCPWWLAGSGRLAVLDARLLIEICALSLLMELLAGRPGATTR